MGDGGAQLEWAGLPEVKPIPLPAPDLVQSLSDPSSPLIHWSRPDPTGPGHSVTLQHFNFPSLSPLTKKEREKIKPFISLSVFFSSFFLVILKRARRSSLLLCCCCLVGTWQSTVSAFSLPQSQTRTQPLSLSRIICIKN